MLFILHTVAGMFLHLLVADIVVLLWSQRGTSSSFFYVTGHHCHKVHGLVHLTMPGETSGAGTFDDKTA